MNLMFPLVFSFQKHWNVIKGSLETDQHITTFHIAVTFPSYIRTHFKLLLHDKVATTFTKIKGNIHSPAP